MLAISCLPSIPIEEEVKFVFRVRVSAFFNFLSFGILKLKKKPCSVMSGTSRHKYTDLISYLLQCSEYYMYILEDVWQMNG